MISRESRLGYWLNSTFGVRGRNNILAWAISGGLAYYLFILPEQRKAEQRKVSSPYWSSCRQAGRWLGTSRMLC